MREEEKALREAIQKSPCDLALRLVLHDYLLDYPPPERWKLIHSQGGAHRYFFDLASGPDADVVPMLAYRVAVADNSGATPDTTADGVLYVDRSRHLLLAHASYCLSLLTPKGERTNTVISRAESSYLVSQLGLRYPPSD